MAAKKSFLLGGGLSCLSRWQLTYLSQGPETTGWTAILAQSRNMLADLLLTAEPTMPKPGNSPSSELPSELSLPPSPVSARILRLCLYHCYFVRLRRSRGPDQARDEHQTSLVNDFEGSTFRRVKTILMHLRTFGTRYSQESRF